MMGKDDLLTAAKTTARIQGCDCDPDVRWPNRQERRDLQKRYGEHDWLHHVQVVHDDWCSLLNRLEGPGNN